MEIGSKELHVCTDIHIMVQRFDYSVRQQLYNYTIIIMLRHDAIFYLCLRFILPHFRAQSDESSGGASRGFKDVILNVWLIHLATPKINSEQLVGPVKLKMYYYYSLTLERPVPPTFIYYALQVDHNQCPHAQCYYESMILSI